MLWMKKGFCLNHGAGSGAFTDVVMKTEDDDWLCVVSHIGYNRQPIVISVFMKTSARASALLVN